MKKFIITVDTEGDNLWINRITNHGLREITTENAKGLERFQILCEKYGFMPTYLTNYEMSQAEPFLDLARAALKNKKCEIGMHMHAWNSPPVVMLPYNPKGAHTYIGEYEPKLQWKKMSYLCETLRDVFQTEILSFRSGRWYLDEFTLKCLEKLNILADCTVTPGISWANHIGNSKYGIDYSQDKYYGEYMISDRNIHKIGKSGVYEIPPTILPRYRLENYRLTKEYCWLRPNGKNLNQMLWVKDRVLKIKRLNYLEFMLHSSEMTAGMSPTFRSARSIEKLFEDMEILFQEIVKDYEGIGLAQYALQLKK